MSSHLHTDVTLFVRIKDGLVKKDRPTTIETCINTTCKQHKKYVGTNFCPACGAKVEEITVMTQQSFNINDTDLIDDFDDCFFQPEGADYIHKTDVFLPYNFNIDNDFFRDEGGVITLEQMSQLKREYMDHYENHKTASLFFKELQNLLGEENVTLEFGVISFYW